MLAVIRALPVVWQVGIGAAILAAAAAGYVYWHHHVYQSGYDAAMLDVAANNKEAIDARNKAVRRVWDCRAADRVWDTTAGVCR
jgi:hypothetical protein